MNARSHGFLSFLATVVGLSVLHAGEPIPLARRPTSELIAQLGSPQFAEREAADGELLKRLGATSQIRDAIPSASPEIAHRLRRILMHRNERAIQRALDIGKRGAIDIMVEQLAAISDMEPVAIGQGLLDVGAALSTRIHMVAPADITRNFTRTFGSDYAEKWRKVDRSRLEPIRFLRDFQQPEDRELTFLAVGEKLRPKSGMIDSLVVQNGWLTTGTARASMIYANGPVQTSSLSQCIVIADDDIDIRGHLTNSVLISRKTIRHKGSAVNGSILLDGNQQGRPGPQIQEWLQFFESADAGIEVVPDKDWVRVTKLIDDLPPAKAGLKVGDIIAAVDGSYIGTVEAFRRVLRRATVRDQTEFTVVCGGKDRIVTASFLGWEPPVLKSAE